MILVQKLILAFLLYLRMGGVQVLLMFFLFQFAYFGFKLLSGFRDRILKKERPRYIRDIGKFVIYFHLGLAVFLLVTGVLISFVNTRGSTANIAEFNAMYMQLDKQIFGVYVPLWLQSTTNPTSFIWSFLAPAAITVFGQLSLVISLTLILLLLISTKEFLRMALALGLTAMLSTPLWFATPSLSPMQGYLDNLLEIEIPADIAQQLETYQPDQSIEEFFDVMRDYQSNGHGGRLLNYTTMPSMHVGWVTVVVFFLIRLRRWLAYICVPFFLLNTLSTVLLVQHYAVDPPAGFLVALLAIFISFSVIRTIPPFLQRIDEMTHNDRRWLVEQLRKVSPSSLLR